MKARDLYARMMKSLAQTGNGRSELDQSTFGSAIEHAQRAGYGQAQAPGLFDSFPFIHEDKIGFQVQG